jgi:hypothetical protein
VQKFQAVLRRPLANTSQSLERIQLFIPLNWSDRTGAERMTCERTEHRNPKASYLPGSRLGELDAS